jgi:amino acid permease
MYSYGSFSDGKGSVGRIASPSNHLSLNDSLLHDESSIETKRQATVSSCVLNLLNTIVGAGMLGLPGAFGGSGITGGTFLLVLGAIFSAHGLLLLARSAVIANHKTNQPSSFYSVASLALPQYTIIIDLAVAAKCFGVACGYLIIISESMVDVMSSTIDALHSHEEYVMNGFETLISSRQFWVIVALVSVLPVSFFRTFHKLSKASAVALMFVAMLVIGIVAHAQGWVEACPTQQQCQGDMEQFTSLSRTIVKLPIFVFSFTCHQNIFPVVNELKDPTPTRLGLVIFTSILSALFIFWIVAVEGYRTYGSNVKGDVLLNYPLTPFVTFLRLSIAAMLTLHYPLQLDPSRKCLSSLIWELKLLWKRKFTRATEESVRVPEISLTNQDGSPIEQQYEQSDLEFFTLTLLFLLGSLSVALRVTDLGVVLALVGATGSTSISYILPALLYLGIATDASFIRRVLAYLQLFIGCMILPMALYFVVRGSLKH